MNVAISSIRTKNHRIDRYELVNAIQDLGYNVKYIGRKSIDKIHSDYEDYNVQFLSVPMTRSNLNPFREIKTIFHVQKTLKKNNIDYLIVYGIRTFPAMVFAARLAGVKKILCIVNGSGRLFQLKGVKGLVAKAMSYPMLCLSFLLSSFVLFQNPDDCQMIKKKGLLLKKNFDIVNGSGVNLTKFKSNKLEVEPVFLMVSRITGSKGVNEYIKAACYVKTIYPESSFYLVGPIDNSDSSIDIELFNKAIDDGVVHFEGKAEDVRPYIHNSRIFVLPSYYPEGIPRSILEAMSMGRPVITTDVPGCRETVINGLNGFLIPKKDVNTLAQKMLWMIEHQKEVKNMGKQSRLICEEKFNVNKVNQFMLKKIDLYES